MEPRPKIDRKLPPKLFFRTYLGLYQHRVDVETGSLYSITQIKYKYLRFVLQQKALLDLVY